MRTIARAFCVWLLVVVAGSPQLFGQALTGTLTGIVMDRSQAVVPNADVGMRNELSGDTRRTVTNSEGYFTIAAVPVGTYTVAVEAAGFAKWERSGIAFNPGDKRHLSDIVLQVGATTEQITVAGVSEMVAVDSSEKSAVITERQLQNIAVVGRSAAELIKVLPGMSMTGSGVENKPGFSGEAIGINGNGDGGRQSALGYYSANGTRGNAMDIVGDGAHASDPGCNCATPVNPNVDMLQEFKVLQSTFSAEHAKGPVVLNFVSKAGGRDFHGTGYFYMRDYRLNANEWLLNKAGKERPQNKYRFPGGNIGGPVLIPGTHFNKNRDKAFFFFGYEYFGQTIDTGVLQANVPTEAMRRGDFSDTAYLRALNSTDLRNPPSGPGIVNGMVPQNMFDPGARTLMNLLPPPNADPAGGGGGFNYVRALTLDQNMQQVLGRVDYSVSDYTKLFVRYNRQDELQRFPVQLWGRSANQVPYPTGVNGDNVSDSVSASLTKVFSPTLTNETIFGLTYINFPNTFEDPQKISRTALGFPYQGIFKNGLEQIPNLNNQGRGAAVMSNRGGFDPVLFAKKWLVSAANNASKVYATHTLKFGAYWEIITNNQPSSGNSQGDIRYRTNEANSSGNSYADLLMGRLASYQEQTKNVLNNIGFRTLEFYAQDSWRATRQLTVEYGARFAHLGAWYDREPFGLAIFDPSRYSNDPADLGKLTGLRWNKIDSSVPRSGGKTRAVFVSPRVGVAYDVFGAGRTILRGGFGVFRYHDPQGPFPGAGNVPAGLRSTSIDRPISLSDVDKEVPATTRIGVTAIDAKDDTQPVNYNWSLTLSQRLPASTLWEISYVGNRSRDLTNDGFANVNLVPFGAMLANPNANPDLFRPFLNYQNINVISHNLYQNYHSLQTTLARHQGRLNYSLAYTFSKVMGIRGEGGATGNRLNVLDNYGPLSYDRTHLFNIAYVIQLPDFSRDAFDSQSRALRAVVDGWQFSGISQFSSGVNLQAAASSNFGLTGFLPGTNTQINSRNMTGTTEVNVQPVLTCDPSQGLGDRQYINGNCFALPAVGRNGDYVFPYLKGPAFMNHDLSLFKDWQLTEAKKLQFRFSAYNFVNHPVWSFTGGDPNLRLSFGRDGQPDNPRFGYADSKFGRRILQLAVKFYF